MEEFEIKDGVLIKYHEIEGKTSVVVPDNVTKIEIGAFEDCISLTNINLPNGIKLNLNIFKNCSNLINVKVSEETFKQLNYDDRYLIISNFVRQYYNNNIYNKDEIDRYKRFILLTIKKPLCDFIKHYYNISESKKQQMNDGGYFEYLLDKYLLPIIKNTPLLYFMCNDMDNAFTANELDELIKVSTEIGEVETTCLLMGYEHNHFGDWNYLDSLNLDEDLGNSK